MAECPNLHQCKSTTNNIMNGWISELVAKAQTAWTTLQQKVLKYMSGMGFRKLLRKWKEGLLIKLSKIFDLSVKQDSDLPELVWIKYAKKFQTPS